MNLYTEEQVKEMLEVCRISHLNDYEISFDDILKTQIPFELNNKKVYKSKRTKLYEIEMSMRLENGLRRYLAPPASPYYFHQFTVAQLSKISLKEFSIMRSIGVKSINELKKLCEQYNVSLKR
jgi:hypothetical protein